MAFKAVCSVADLEPLKPIRKVLPGYELPIALILLHDKNVVAIGDVCPHAKADLSRGDIEVTDFCVLVFELICLIYLFFFRI